MVVTVLENDAANLLIQTLTPHPILDKWQEEMHPNLTPAEKLVLGAVIRKIIGVVSEIVVSPRMIMDRNPGPEELSVWKIPSADINFLFQYVLDGRVNRG